MNKKTGLILLGVGVGIAMLVCMISLSAYGKIYFFDGYDITKFAWVVSFGCCISGLVSLISDSKAWVVTLVIALVIALCVSCGGSFSSSNSGSGKSNDSGNSNGSYRCNNCGGDGWDSENNCKCVWCGGDGKTSWNP